MTTYQLTKPIRSKIFNYRQTVSAFNIDFFQKSTCDCRLSTFCDAQHKHIITGDLRIVKNKQLRELLRKGPQYRELQPTNWKHAFESVKEAVENYIDKVSKKEKLAKILFREWKTELLQLVTDRIKQLRKQRVNYRAYSLYKPKLKQQCIIDELKALHEKYVLVPIDEASKNVAVICKRFYLEKILAEIGYYTPSDTYKIDDKFDPSELIDSQCKVLKEDYNIDVADNMKKLPFIYWIPKFHKNPIKQRFIISSSYCCTKKLAKLLCCALRL
ncbi:unnamed protein product, partial [Didymodactylos carnosus]